MKKSLRVANLRGIVAKGRKWERVFFLIYGTKWTLSFKVEPIGPRSEFRAEQLICFFMCDLGTIVPKNVFLLITWERVFIKKNTEQNGP